MGLRTGKKGKILEADNVKMANRASNSKGAIPSPSGARASNAGDEFHFRYSARLALRLLDKSSGLTFLQIEGAEDFLAGDSRFQAIDTTEYFGGMSIMDSIHVVANQLKYSSTHPGVEWTISRLAAKRGANRPSIIKQLSDAFEEFVIASSPEIVRSKLTIRLVSNQPASKSLVNSVSEAKRVLTKYPDGLTYAKLRSQLTSSCDKAIASLRSATSLTSRAFCEFLRVLDFSGCGQGALATQDALLVKEAGPLMGDLVGQGIKTLVGVVRDLALPGRDGEGLVADEVAAALGAASIDELFPAPPAFASVEDPLETLDVSELAGVLNQHHRVLAHGEAGIGKSTTIQLLENALPAGSVVIAYDCWGAGECFTYGGARHTHSRAIRQIINELSVRLGLPLLIGQVSANVDLEFRLKKRLQAASQAVPGGLLVVAIDAADNAIVAASESDSFVENLWSLDLPENCRLVMTARTHRKSLLKAPETIKELQLAGFSANTSAEHLRRSFPSATEEEGKAFHQVSGGNPRLEAYKLATANKAGLLSVALDARLGKLDELFDDLLKSTTNEFGKAVLGRQLVGGLVCMPRPIQISEFASAHGFSSAEARIFLSGFAPAISIQDELATLRDEDFDAFLRRSLSPSELRSANDRLATFLLGRGLNAAYAARAISEHLFGAERFVELVELGLSGEGLDSITDDLLRVQIMRRRLALALEGTIHSRDLFSASKLLLLASRASRSDFALTELIKERPELAAAYGDPEAVSKVLLRSDSESWFGPAHLRAAALCARSPSRQGDAIRHLDEARAWLRLYSTKSENDRHHWQLSAADLSYGGQAVYFLYGLDPALKFMLGWRPTEDIIERFFRDLVGRRDSNALCREVATAQRPQWVDLFLATSLWKFGKVATAEILEPATKAGLRAKPPERASIRDNQHDFIGLAEARTAAKCDTPPTLELLSKTRPLPDNLKLGRPNLKEHQEPLRAYCLNAVLSGGDLSLDALIERAFPEDEQKPVPGLEQRRKDAREALSPIFPMYALRAQAIAGAFPRDGLEQIRAEATARARGSGRLYGEADPTYYDWANMAFETVLLVQPSEGDLLQQVANVGTALYGIAGSEAFLGFAAKAVRVGAVEVGTWLLTSVERDLQKRKMPAQEKSNLLLEAASIAERFDETLSHDLYLSAVSAADGVDNESAAIVSLLGKTFVNAKSRKIVQLRHKEYALRLAKLLEIHQPYVSDNDYLPDRSVLSSVTQLWPAGGLAVGTRWADLDLMLEYKSAPVIAETLTEVGYFGPRVGLAILQLSGAHYNPTYHGQRILDIAHTLGVNDLDEAFRVLGERLLRNTDVSERAQSVDGLVEWANSHGVGSTPTGLSLRSTLSFAEANQLINNHRSYRHDRSEQIEEILEKLDLFTPVGVAESFAKLVANYAADIDVNRFADRIENRIPYGSRLTMLQAFLDVELPDYRNQKRALLIANLLEKWTNAAVRSAIPELVGSFFDRYAVPLPISEDGETNYLRILANSAGSTFDLLAATARTISKSIDELGPQSFYAFADLLSTSLEDAEFVALFEWFMGIMDDHTGESSALPDPSLIQFEAGMHDAVAQYLWKVMGYQSRPMTWLAVHAAREVALSEGPAFIESLVGLLGRRDAHPFSEAGTEHLWMSARVMLLVLFLRLANEAGALVRPHASVFATIAVDQAFPHAQMRELARRICSTKEVRAELDQETLDAISLANRPRSCSYPRVEEAYRLRNRSDPIESAKFNFDSMDTVPYWFRPLDRVFGEPLPDTVARADRWISNQWGRTNEECSVQGARRWGDWDDTSNRHGSIPPVETLRHHLEFHAMMCAAGEMCDEGLPLAVSPWESMEDPWDDWLAEHLPARGDIWMSELREGTPLEANLWKELPTDEEWCDRVTTEDLADSAKLTSDYVVLDAGIYHSGYSSYEHVDVSSALISPKAAISLAAAIEGAQPYQFRLPRSTDERASLSSGRFQLRSTVGVPQRPDRFDKLDPLRGDGSRSPTFLAPDLLSSLSIVYDEARESYADSKGQVEAKLQYWDDTRRSRFRDARGSHGTRLLVSRAALVRALNRLRMDLIIAVEITRTVRRGYEQLKEHRTQTTRALIIRRDGRIDPIRRDNIPRRKNNKSARTRAG